MSRRESIRLATRGSDLALRQASEVKAALEEHRHDVELVEVETEGDRVTDAMIRDLGRTGAFVRALDERVIDGDVDAAVHSLKDMPTELPEEIEVAAVPRRASAGDVLVTRDGTAFEDLPSDAIIGTSSLRRKAQALAKRPDLTVEPLRGNVDTRIEKLLAPALQTEHERRIEAEKEQKSGEERDRKQTEFADEEDNEPTHAGDREYEQTAEEWFESLSELEKQALGRKVETEYDAIVLARAGLERSGLGRDVGMFDLPREEFVPAPGQGALAITASAESDIADTIRSALDHPRSRVETTVERLVLEELNGGCIAPIGVHAMVKGEIVHTSVQVFSQDGSEQVSETRDLDVDEYVKEARELASDLADRGAADLVEQARKQQ